jgi:dsDNA-binding SOS-regulon protein
MAVVAVWKCDRDGTMFDNKKEAEEHDKMLELAANITCLIEKNMEIDEKLSEAIGLLLAEHRDNLAVACKGKPSVLLEVDAPEKVNDVQKSEAKTGIVTPLAANQ